MALIRLNNQSISSVTALPSGVDVGKIGQVVTNTIGSSSWQTTTTTGSWLNYDDGTSDLELDITPSATSSKIFLIVEARIQVNRTTAGNHDGISTRILHNETTAIHAMGTGNDDGFKFYDGSTSQHTQNVNLHFVHSPNSTSSQNYIFQMRFSGSQQFKYGINFNTITAMEILA